MTENVLLIGAAGPLGCAVSRELTQRAHTVTGSSRAGGTGFEQLDVTDRSQSGRVLQRVKPTVVVYLARPALEFATDIPQAIDDAVRALRDFTALCLERDVARIVFASSAAVYGTSARSPRRESDEPFADSPYAELKLRSEHALAEVGAVREGFACSLRIFNVFGSGFSNSLVNRLANGAAPPPPVVDTDQFVRDYIHCTDVARAFASAAEADGLLPPLLNVGTGIGTDNHSLLAMFPRVERREHADLALPSISIADISQIRSLWGFAPRVSVEMAASEPAQFL